MYTNWRTIPATVVLSIIYDEQRRTGSRIDALLSLLERHGYAVVFIAGKESYVNHAKRLVLLPAASPADHEQMLLHETAEVLLRLPVAPEFHYQPTWRDEHHEVACLVERALL